MDVGTDRLEFQHLAGGNIVKHAPVFSEDGSFLFVRCDHIVQVYSTGTGELIRELKDATQSLISLELELKQPDVLVACTSDGELLRWHWRTGVLQKMIKLNLLNNSTVLTFNLLNMYKDSEYACAWVTMKLRAGGVVNWSVVDTLTGRTVKVSMNLFLKNQMPIIDVGVKKHKFIAIAQGFYLSLIDYTKWQTIRYKNANLVPLTVVRFNPVEEMLATGDEQGRILLWRQFDKLENMLNARYHWHHTAVTSIAFSGMGTSFYSSGLESVLVKWNIKKPDFRQYLPRMSSVIRHVVVSAANEQVVVCMEDNSVQFVGASDNLLKSTVQNFTYAQDDKTGRSKFPIGLCLNPRSNTLVLNGRMGHLQFYSAYTKNLLYNLSIVDQNKQSMEAEQILYNVQVTKAAFNIDWMATGEVFNDEEHLPILTLKFWKYKEDLQRYQLNTCVELPHEGGFKAIAFSNIYQVDNLRCATVGHDHAIKMWALEDSCNIYRKGKIWTCVGRAEYKGMSIESISFSQDGSLLAAGFGNTLCIYKTDTFKLRAQLTATAAMDGVFAKAQLRLAKKSVNGAKTDYIEKRNKLWLLFKRLLETDDQKIVDEIKKILNSSSPCAQTTQAKDIDIPRKDKLFTKINNMPDLSLHHKLQLYRMFGIQCQVHEKWQTKMAEYLRETIVEPKDARPHVMELDKKLHRVNIRQRYKAKYRLHQYITRNLRHHSDLSGNLVSIMSMLNLDLTTKGKQPTTPTQSKKKPIQNSSHASKKKSLVTPIESQAEITHLQFGAGEFAHLVVACTESRLLVWNLMTLRLKAVLKLSVRYLAFDPLTNLMAVVNKRDELYVFQVQVPIPIYQRAKIPKLYGLIWLPRRYPKQRSINVDWQAQSTLYFLTDNQEITYLSTSEVSDEPTVPVSFASSAAPDKLLYSTFGAFAAQTTTDKDTLPKQQSGPLIVGRGRDSTVNTLVDLSTHTMPPLNMICREFIKSLLNAAETSVEHENSKKTGKDTLTNGVNGYLNGNGLHLEDGEEDDDAEDDDKNDFDEDDDGDGDVSMKTSNDATENDSKRKYNLELRKSLLTKPESLLTKTDQTPQGIEHRLESLGKINLTIDL